MGRRCRNVSRIFIYVVMFIFSASLLGVGNTLRKNGAHTISAPGFLTNDVCLLLEKTVVQCGGGGRFVAVWKRSTNIDGGPDMAVVSPFAVRTTREEAEYDLQSYGDASGDNTTRFKFDCSCLQVKSANRLYPDVSCDLRNTCMLDKAATAYVRQVGWLYDYSGNAALAIGSLLLVLFTIVTIVLFIDLGFFQCCCNNVEIPYRQPSKEDFS